MWILLIITLLIDRSPHAVFPKCLQLFVLHLIGFVGRLWIHAAGKIPEEATIKAMEDFYREIYAVDGITDIKFPTNYPTSRLLGACLYTFIH